MYEVIKTFTDKYDGSLHKEGEIINISPERAKEILSVDKLIKKIKTPKEVNK